MFYYLALKSPWDQFQFTTQLFGSPSSSVVPPLAVQIGSQVLRRVPVNDLATIDSFLKEILKKGDLSNSRKNDFRRAISPIWDEKVDEILKFLATNFKDFFTIHEIYTDIPRVSEDSKVENVLLRLVMVGNRLNCPIPFQKLGSALQNVTKEIRVIRRFDDESQKALGQILAARCSVFPELGRVMVGSFDSKNRPQLPPLFQLIFKNSPPETFLKKLQIHQNLLLTAAEISTLQKTLPDLTHLENLSFVNSHSLTLESMRSLIPFLPKNRQFCLELAQTDLVRNTPENTQLVLDLCNHNPNLAVLIEIGKYGLWPEWLLNPESFKGTNLKGKIEETDGNWNRKIFLKGSGWDIEKSNPN
jgi:hypothetical protein